MKRIGLVVFSLVVAVGLLIGGQGVAKANYTVDFDISSAGIAPSTEIISYTAATGGKLVGVDIPVVDTYVEFAGVPETAVLNGRLSFSTGTYAGMLPTTSKIWSFADNSAPNALVVTGTVGSYTGILYTASLSDCTVTKVSGTANTFKLQTLGATVGTYIAPQLLAALGLSGVVVDPLTPGDVTITFNGVKDTSVTNGIGWVSLSGGHVEAPTTVPIPPSVLLLAPGLLGLIGIRKRSM
jgi:hypothetical protein